MNRNDSRISHTRSVSLEDKTKFTWKRKRGGACSLLTIPPLPFPSVGKVEEERQRFSRNVGYRSSTIEEKSRSSVLSPARQPPRDGPRQKSTWLLSRRKRYRFLRHGMHRETFIIPGLRHRQLERRGHSSRANLTYVFQRGFSKFLQISITNFSTVKFYHLYNSL